MDHLDNQDIAPDFVWIFFLFFIYLYIHAGVDQNGR